jgi:metal-responsive CopG/Arc/MetJ family transcriptional regulator
MKTIQMTIDEALLERVDRVTKSLGIPRSAFIRQALELALREIKIDELQQRHGEGYQRFPVAPGEFDIWEKEHAWGEQSDL